MPRSSWVLTIAFLSFASIASAGGAIFPITNFSEVTPGLFRGARPSKEGMNALAQMGIRSLVNLQGGDLRSHYPSWIIAKFEPGETPAMIEAERIEASSRNMQFVSAPIDSLDDVTADEDRLIDHVLGFMAEPKNQPVFVHCEHGIDRTGLIIALYEVKYLGVSIEGAHQDMVKHGHDPLHQVFTHDMDDYFYQKAKQIRGNGSK